jgi:hypothetical protein
VHHAAHFDGACITVRKLVKRRKKVPCDELLIDSGAFMELSCMATIAPASPPMRGCCAGWPT